MEFKEKYGPWGMVVGSSSGLGKCFARELASHGLNVVISARPINHDELEDAKNEIIRDFGVEVRIVEVDISDASSGDTLIQETEDLEIGFLIYNAAIEPGGPFIRVKPSDHEKAIIGNCLTPTKVVWPLARKMAKRGKGAIYLVSSIAAEGGIANWVSYGASKSYELILGEGLWYELRKHGVDAGSYVVGATETPNFKASQEKHGTHLSSDSSITDTTLPRTPSFVASYLFEQLGKGPRLYSHPDDLKNMNLMRTLSREDYVTAISATTEKYHHGGTNELVDEEDELIYRKPGDLPVFLNAMHTN